MPDYSGIINTIETAVYGRDMRQAIANGFRLCQSNEGGGGGGSVTVDTTLTVSGQAADSKTVGDKFTDLESQISAISPGLSRAEKDAILAYFAEQVEIHPSLEDAYQAIYNLWNKPVNSITLNKHSLMLAVGMSEKLLVTIDPPDAYDQTVTWSSSPEGIVSVAQDGTVMALQDGRATVTASCGGKTDSCSVTAVQMNYYSVTNNLTNVTNSNSASSVLEGESYSATLSVSSDYNLTDVQITMGGTNITSSAYNGETREIYIASVSGNITITASATKIVYYSVMWQLSNASVSGDQPSTVLGGSTFHYTIKTNSGANYEINSVQVLMGDSDITATAVIAGGEGRKFVTIDIDSVSGNIKIIVSAVVAIKALNDCTWAEISQISSSGQAANTFSVGDQKTITFTGNGNFNDGMRLTGDIDVFILGINHNASHEGNNLIHFCMGKSDGQLVVLYNAVQGDDTFNDGTSNDTSSAVLGCYDDYVSSSEQGANRYGFGMSGMSYLCGKYVSNLQTSRVGVIGSLPTDLRAVMKKATKYYDTESSISSIQLPMSIPSVYELRGVHYSGTETWSDQNQQQYEYFESGNSYVAKEMQFNSSGNQGISPSEETYWLRNRVSSARDTTERNYVAMNGVGSLERLYDGTFNFACMFLFFV